MKTSERTKRRVEKLAAGAGRLARQILDSTKELRPLIQLVVKRWK